MTTDTLQLSPNACRAIEIYEQRLKAKLEPHQNGNAVAIDPASGEYAVGANRSEAFRKLHDRLPSGSAFVSLTIGPPTESEIQMATRISSGPKS